jgi:hypothetical protein
MYYFHEVPVTLLNDFQQKPNTRIALRSSCHMIIDATGALRTRRPVLNSLPYNFRMILRDFRLLPQSRRNVRPSGISQKSAHLFRMTLNKNT